MPEHSEHSERFVAALYDQDEDRRTPDWGGDELFTRMPRRRAPDTAPPPRFRPALTLVETPAERREGPRDVEDPRPERPGEASLRERAERLGLSLVDERPFLPEPAAAPAEHPLDAVVRQWDGALVDPDHPAAPPRSIRVITGHPGGVPQALPLVHAQRSAAERRRAVRTHAEWVGPRPERIVGWAFALGLILLLIAISTADAATF